MTLALACVPRAHAASTSLSCTAAGVPAIVRAEGLAEPVGDILLTCTGTPGGTVSGNLTVFLNVNITNRLTAAGNLVGATLTADTGGAPVPATLGSVNSAVFEGFNFTVSAFGQLGLRISGLRGNPGQLGIYVGPPPPQVQAFVSADISVSNATVMVATGQTGLLANYSSSISCGTSPIPSTISLSNLFAAGVVFASTRITEGFPTAFQKRGPADDSGTRILVRYSSFPAGSHVFVPDAIAGSDALVPTAGGDLGVQRSGGQWAPSAAGSLLLLRVAGSDANGAGGSTVAPAGFNSSGVSTFDSASEILLQNGSAIVVYEVVDANPSVRETAQFPVFLSAGALTNGQSATVAESLSLAPVSTVSTATATDPVPRFVSATPPSDCTALGDCNASYFPKLNVVAPSLAFTAQAGSGTQVQYVQVQNAGGGVFNWTASIAYTSGSGWVLLSPYPGTLRIDVMPQNLAAGTYQATLTISAGSAGTKTLPISLIVTPAPAPPPPQPVPTISVTAMTNAATFAAGPVVPGSLATIMGSNLAGTNVSVTFDGLVAPLLYTGAQQINLQVPPGLGAKATAQLVVTVDGVASAPQTVTLAAVAPGIFNPGILNQDNSVNGPNNPAPAGSIVQIYATGLGTGTAVTARIANDTIASPYYGGPAPGLIGVQQVNIAVPADVGAGPADIEVCGSTGAQAVCSPAGKIYIR